MLQTMFVWTVYEVVAGGCQDRGGPDAGGLIEKCTAVDGTT